MSPSSAERTPWRPPVGPRRRRLIALALAAALAAVYVAWGRAGWLGEMEARTLDWRFQLRGPVPAGERVAVVTVDEASLQALGGWPLDRRHLAAGVEQLTRMGARTIAFDLLLVERRPRLPEELRATLRELNRSLGERVPPALARALDGAADGRLADAMRSSGRVVLPFAFTAADLAVPRSDGLRVPARAAFESYRIAASAPSAPALPPSAAVVPDPALAQAAAGLGHATVVLDGDGALRHHLPVVAAGGEYYPSLALEAARLARGVPRAPLEIRAGGLTVGALRVPTDADLRLTVNHYGPPGRFPSVSLADLLDGEVPAEAIEGRVAIVGARAAGLGETFATPFTGAMPSVEVHATVVDNLLSGRALGQPLWARAVDALAILLLGLAAGEAAARLAPLGAGFAAGTLAGAWTVTAYAAFAAGQLWLAAVMPLASIAGSAVWGQAARAIDEAASRRRVERERGNLMRYFSPAVAETLAVRDTPFALDRQQEAAVMFVDLVGFTGLAEKLDPAEAIELLRGFHRLVERAVFAHDGSLDKYMGDGALATFGVPEPAADDALQAIAAAKDLAAAVRGWQRDLTAAGRPAPGLAIGIHHGPVLMGDLGGEKRFEFTVVGDTVNVASRLEHLARPHHAILVVSDEAMRRAEAALPATEDAAAELLAGFEALPAEAVRGREAPVVPWIWQPPAEA